MILRKISKIISIGLLVSFLAFKPTAICSASSASSVMTSTYTDDLVKISQIDKKEKECIVETLYYEARSEGRKGLLAVASVLQERKQHPDYPSTYCKISKQYKQFSFRLENKPSAKALERSISSLQDKDVEMLGEAKKIADSMLLGAFRGILPKGTLFYHAKYVKPTWSKGMKKVAAIGQHVFYRKA